MEKIFVPSLEQTQAGVLWTIIKINYSFAIMKLKEVI
jgi:hypothetical protein